MYCFILLLFRLRLDISIMISKINMINLTETNFDSMKISDSAYSEWELVYAETVN